MGMCKLHAFADEASGVLDEQVAAMKRNNLDGLEIRNVDGQSISEISLQKAALVRRKMADAGLTVWSIGSPIGKISIINAFAPHLEMLKHTLDIAKVLGTERIRMFSFYIPKDETPENYRNAVMDRIGAMLDVARDSGIALCHENEKGIYGDNAARCKELLDAFPTLRGIFDPANFIQVGQDTWQAWQLLKGRIDYLHLKDALSDGKVVPVGHGIGRVADIVSEYIANGGRNLTIEPHLTVFDSLHSLERSGEESGIDLYAYETANQAFDAGCAAVKQLLQGGK